MRILPNLHPLKYITLTLKLSVSLILLSSVASAQRGNTSTAAGNDVTIHVKDELASLAEGYAAAFLELPAGPKFVQLRLNQGSETRVLAISKLTAHGGVVFLQVEKGPSYLVNPKTIDMVTNERLEAR